MKDRRLHNSIKYFRQERFAPGEYRNIELFRSRKSVSRELSPSSPDARINLK